MDNEMHFAVVVGINGYPGIRHLTKAVNDALSFRDWLIADGGVPEDQIQLIKGETTAAGVNPIEATPTRDDINRAFKRVNQAVMEKTRRDPLAWEQSRLYVYVSGHGISPEGAEAALFTANAGPEAWAENIACGLYTRRYERCQQFREVIVFADCCRLWKEAYLPEPPFSTIGTNGTVRTLLGFATQQGEQSFEPTSQDDPEEARSYFTQALLEGLRGAAAEDGTGRVTDESLARYTVERVRLMTADKRYPQIPSIRPDPSNPIVLCGSARREAPTLHPVQLYPPPGYTGRLELRDHTFAVLKVSGPGESPWQVRLGNGLYQARVPDGEASADFNSDGMFRVLGGGCDVRL
jgi:hypothetical protein